MFTISSKIYTILSGFPIVDQIYVCSLLVYNFWAWRYWKRVPALIWQHSLYGIYSCCNLLSFLLHCFPFCPIDQARVKEMNISTSLLLMLIIRPFLNGILNKFCFGRLLKLIVPFPFVFGESDILFPGCWFFPNNFWIALSCQYIVN